MIDLLTTNEAMKGAPHLSLNDSTHAFTSARFFWRWVWLAVLLVVIDQVTKLSIASILPLHGQMAVTPFFNLVHVLNPGAAFSFLAGAGGWQLHALTVIGVLVSVGLIILLQRGVRHRLEAIAYACIIGGAMGNVLDRLRLGAVVDFLDVYWKTTHWPAFNLADVFIVIGVALILLSSFRSRTDPAKSD